MLFQIRLLKQQSVKLQGLVRVFFIYVIYSFNEEAATFENSALSFGFLVNY